MVAVVLGGRGGEPEVRLHRHDDHEVTDGPGEEVRGGVAAGIEGRDDGAVVDDPDADEPGRDVPVDGLDVSEDPDPLAEHRRAGLRGDGDRVARRVDAVVVRTASLPLGEYASLWSASPRYCAVMMVRPMVRVDRVSVARR